MSNTTDIQNQIKNAAQKRNEYSYESAEYNFWDDKIAELSKQIEKKSPLETNLSEERKSFMAQKFTGADLQKANKWCLDRGYSLAELQAAAKAAK